MKCFIAYWFSDCYSGKKEKIAKKTNTVKLKIVPLYKIQPKKSMVKEIKNKI